MTGRPAPGPGRARYVFPGPVGGAEGDTGAMITAVLAGGPDGERGPAGDEGRVLRWWFHADPVQGAAQTGVVLAEQPGPWDLGLAAEVSRRTGGFLVASQTGPEPGPAGAALLHVGRVLRAWYRDPSGRVTLRAGLRDVPGPGYAEADASELLLALTGWALASLLPVYVRTAGEVAGSVAGATGPETLPASAGLHQVVLSCDEECWRAWLATGPAAAAGRDDWRWRSGRTAEAGIGYVMLRGREPADPGWVRELATGTDSFAAAVSVGGSPPSASRPAVWTWVSPDGDERTGQAVDGLAVLEVWQDIASVLGSRPGSLVWPTGEPGHRLAVPG